MEDLFEALLSFAFFLIPLAGIGLAAFSQWLKFKEKQAKLGASTDALEKEMKALKASISEKDEALNKRIQNLETIVTSQVWDAINSENVNLPPPLLDDILPPAKEEPSDTQRAEQIAKRLNN